MGYSKYVSCRGEGGVSVPGCGNLLGVGVGNKSTSNLSRSGYHCKGKRSNLSKDPEGFGAAHRDTGPTSVTIVPGHRSYYPQDQHREQRSDLEFRGVKRQTEVSALTPTLSGLLSVGNKEARNSSGWPS